jgi:hypothetical protein
MAKPVCREPAGGRAKFFGLVGASLLDGRASRAADWRLLSLIAEHRRLEDAVLSVEDEVEALLRSDRRMRRVRSANTEAACARAEKLHTEQARIANALINTPAATFAGVAYKLVVWRREVATSHRDDFELAHETFTFSAYQDLLRLSGLEALAHTRDGATFARMKTYWMPR